ncbi:hypothetical protein BAC3_02422 [uncultured bacterium]|nr:hypothetical protein BAC3_02422 [uncultured bacterium]
MNKIFTLTGISSFISIVIYLNIIQTAYNPLYQLMSELALGEQGFLMLVAFLSFALAVISVSHTLNHSILKTLLWLAALALAAAGIFKLGEATVLHVALVAIAFVLIVLSMYLTPRLTSTTTRQTFICWGLGFSTALFVALGQGILPIGLAQRLATLSIFIWLAWLAITHQREHYE